MSDMDIALTRPTRDLFDTWMRTVAEFGDEKIHGFGIDSPAPATRETLDALLARAELVADTTRPAADDWVHNDLYWITDDREIVGFLSLRHDLNDFLREVGGHIGYSIRPSCRRQGYASRALALALERSRAIGLERVLITCDDDNVGSARTIEGAGGLLEGVYDRTEYGYPRLRRYWIDLDTASGRTHA